MASPNDGTVVVVVGGGDDGNKKSIRPPSRPVSSVEFQADRYRPPTSSASLNRNGHSAVGRHHSTGHCDYYFSQPYYPYYYRQYYLNNFGRIGIGGKYIVSHSAGYPQPVVPAKFCSSGNFFLKQQSNNPLSTTKQNPPKAKPIRKSTTMIVNGGPKFQSQQQPLVQAPESNPVNDDNHQRQMIGTSVDEIDEKVDMEMFDLEPSGSSSNTSSSNSNNNNNKSSQQPTSNGNGVIGSCAISIPAAPSERAESASSSVAKAPPTPSDNENRQPSWLMTRFCSFLLHFLVLCIIIGVSFACGILVAQHFQNCDQSSFSSSSSSSSTSMSSLRPQVRDRHIDLAGAGFRAGKSLNGLGGTADRSSKIPSSNVVYETDKKPEITTTTTPATTTTLVSETTVASQNDDDDGGDNQRKSQKDIDPMITLASTTTTISASPETQTVMIINSNHNDYTTTMAATTPPPDDSKEDTTTTTTTTMAPITTTTTVDDILSTMIQEFNEVLNETMGQVEKESKFLNPVIGDIITTTALPTATPNSIDQYFDSIETNRTDISTELPSTLDESKIDITTTTTTMAPTTIKSLVEDNDDSFNSTKDQMASENDDDDDTLVELNPDNSTTTTTATIIENEKNQSMIIDEDDDLNGRAKIDNNENDLKPILEISPLQKDEDLKISIKNVSINAVHNNSSIPEMINHTDYNNSTDGSIVSSSSETPELCLDTQFRCPNFNNTKNCLDNSRICDGINDCGDNYDEKDCLKKNCGINFRCGLDTPDDDPIGFQQTTAIANNSTINGLALCIPRSYYCDGIWDCDDGSDEIQCHIKRCEPDKVPCRDNSACITGRQACDGVYNCRDRSDEVGCGTRSSCENSGKFYCDNALCISKANVCDGIPDCDNGEDEKDCVTPETCKSLDGKFFCIESKQCLSLSQRCDGKIDCSDFSDEDGCFETDTDDVVYVYNGQQQHWSLLCVTDQLSSSLNDFGDRLCSTIGMAFASNIKTVPIKEMKNNSTWAILNGTIGTAMVSMAVSGDQQAVPVSISVPATPLNHTVTEVKPPPSMQPIPKPIGQFGPITFGDHCPSNMAIQIECEPLFCDAGQLALRPSASDGPLEVPEEVPAPVFITNTTTAITNNGTKEFKCLAYALSARWLITSGRCLQNLRWKNSTMENLTINGYYPVEQIRRHPKYSDFRTLRFPDYDLAMIRTAITLPKSILNRSSICLPKNKLDPEITCFVGNGEIAFKLLDPIVCNSTRHLAGTLTERQICGERENSGGGGGQVAVMEPLSEQPLPLPDQKDASNSNGNDWHKQFCLETIPNLPLMCLTSQSKWYLAGFATYQRGCNPLDGKPIFLGYHHHPTLFSNLFSMKPFIEQTLGHGYRLERFRIGDTNHTDDNIQERRASFSFKSNDENLMNEATTTKAPKIEKNISTSQPIPETTTTTTTMINEPPPTTTVIPENFPEIKDSFENGNKTESMMMNVENEETFPPPSTTTTTISMDSFTTTTTVMEPEIMEEETQTESSNNKSIEPEEPLKEKEEENKKIFDHHHHHHQIENSSSIHPAL